MLVGAACGDNLKPAVPLDAAIHVDAPPDGPPMCTPPAVSPTGATVTSGDLAIDALSMVAAAASSAPLDSSVLFFSLREAEQSPTYGNVMCVLQAADPVATTPAGVVCKRNQPGTDNAASTGVINVHWTIVTFATGVSVQRGTVNTNIGFTDPAIVNLSPTIDTSSSFVVMGGGFDGGTGWGNNEFATGVLLDASTLQLSTTVPGSELAYQVVTMAGASVQRGSAGLAMTDTETKVTITAAPSGSFALASYTTDNPSGIAAADLMVQTSMLDPQTLDFQRAAGGAVVVIAWEVVSLPYTTIAGTTTFAAGVTTGSGAAPGIVAASSVAISSSESLLGQSAGSTTYAGTELDLLGEAAATMVTGAGTVNLTRASSNASATIPWTVIDFGHDCAGN